MKEVKKLLEKIEQTPNKIIEKAIDNLSKKMNKEEIETLLNKCDNCKLKECIRL